MVMNDSAHLNTQKDEMARPEDQGGKQPTVLQILPALGGSGGVERGTVEIAGAITAAGGRALVASEGGLLVHDLTRVHAEHITLPVASKNPLVMYRNIERMVDLIKRERVDVVHVRSRAPAWSAYIACQRAKVPLVTTFHGTYSIGNWLKRKYNAVMTFGDRVIAISTFIGGHIRRHYGVPVEKIRVIHRGVDLERFDPEKISAERVIKLATEWRLPDGMPIVMLPGRLTRWKGQLVLIDAIAKLDRKDIRCLLVGSAQGRDDYRRELENRITLHSLEEVIRIVDHCDDMPAAYKLTDLVVSASTDPEAFGRIICEAQAMGRPVIASDHGGARETVLPGVTGWLTPPGDADALAMALEVGLALNGAARTKLAAIAIEHVRKNFSKNQMCDKTLDVYNEVLAARGRS
jgi:glycosyltransferase involved in cell wall biosynthesis